MKYKRIQFLIILVLALSLLSLGSGQCYGCVIRVYNQQQLDKLQGTLMQRINEGETNIRVIINRGIYVAKEQNISIQNIKAPNTTIRIIGKNAILVPEGTTYHDGDVYQGTFSPEHSWMNGADDINIWSDICYADGLIEVLDKDKKTCRLKSREHFSTDVDFSNAYILIPHWFKSSVYKIDRIEKNYIYFTAADLAAGYEKDYNINDDYNYGKLGVRYKLCNVNADYMHIKNGRIYLPQSLSSVREGTTKCYISFKNNIFRSVTIKGMRFYGNAYSNSNAVVYIHNNQCEDLQIQKCVFRGHRGRSISINSTANVRVENNQFYDCYDYVVSSDNGSKNTIVKNNHFDRMGKRLQSTFCISCKGEDYLISDNKLKDYGYGGICSGIWYKNPKLYPCKGLIEKNELVFTDTYCDNIANYGIMDGGAIYLMTKNDGVVIRNNYIYKYTGLNTNHGIFCDDGAYNVRVLGNVIIGINNGSSIDSRRVTGVELTKSPESGIERANVNVVIS